MDRETFTHLVLDSEQTLYRISMSMLKNEKDCEDAVQNAILTAYEKLSTLRKPEYFKTWLVRILMNECNRQLKLSKKHLPLTSEEIQASASSTEEVEVRMVIENLPSKFRQVIMLYYIEQFSVKEIKQILKIPEGTVKSRLSKGRELLRTELL